MTATKTQQSKVIHRQFEGEVVSDVEEKTIHVLVRLVKWNKKWEKQYVTTKKYAVHDEKNAAKVGDTVVFEECRPLSKSKRWRLVEVKN